MELGLERLVIGPRLFKPILNVTLEILTLMLLYAARADNAGIVLTLRLIVKNRDSIETAGAKGRNKLLGGYDTEVSVYPIEIHIPCGPAFGA